MRLEITHKAKLDIADAAAWYDEKQAGLGRRFTAALRKEFNYIQQKPESFAIRYKNIHTAVVSVFPYMIHYVIDPDKKLITVIAVFHTSINPKKWK